MENKNNMHPERLESKTLEERIEEIQENFKSWAKFEIKYLNAVLKYSFSRILLMLISIVLILSSLLSIGLTLSFYIFSPVAGFDGSNKNALIYYIIILSFLLITSCLLAWGCSRKIAKMADKYFEHWEN